MGRTKEGLTNKQQKAVSLEAKEGLTNKQKADRTKEGLTNKQQKEGLTNKQLADRAFMRAKKLPREGERVQWTDYAGRKHVGLVRTIEGSTAWVLFDDRPITEAMNLSTLRKE